MNIKIVLAYIIKWSSLGLFIFSAGLLSLDWSMSHYNTYGELSLQNHIIYWVVELAPAVVGVLFFWIGNRWAKSLKSKP